jgi:type VI secretion system secreted protein VgrG
MSSCRRPNPSSTGDGTPAGSTTAECPLAQNRLVSVKILDGGTTEASARVDQFVNLPEDNKWVTDGIANVDRLTEKLRVRVRFQRAGTERFRLRFLPGSSNIVYSAAEKGRNAKYDYSPQDEQSYTTDADGTKILNDVHSVAVAGGNTYNFEARDDHGTVQRSGDVRVRRRVFVQEIKMQGSPCAASLGTFIGEYNNHHLQIIQLPSVQMARIENVGTDSTPFQDAARTAYTGSQGPNKERYCVALAYTDHEAVKDANVSLEYANQSVGPGQGPLTLSVVNAAGSQGYLWNNIVTGEGWFVSASFLKNGAAEAARVNILQGKCTAVQATGRPADMCDRVSVVVNDLTTTVQQGTVRLVLNVVNRMRGGLSFGGGNLICICTRAWWSTTSEADQNQTMIHEMGHKLGMVPNNDDLDRPTNQYDGSGHVGSHCHAGVAAMANYGSASGSTCVIFGSTNGRTAFCAGCAPCIKKRAEDTGWSAF